MYRVGLLSSNVFNLPKSFKLHKCSKYRKMGFDHWLCCGSAAGVVAVVVTALLLPFEVSIICEIYLPLCLLTIYVSSLQVKKDSKRPFLLSGCKVQDGQGIMLVSSPYWSINLR